MLAADGVGSLEVARDIKPLLPNSENGQILITGRDHGWITSICDQKDDWKCTEMKPLDRDVSYDIFRRYLKSEYDDEDKGGT
jgi:hypothetical protein